MDYQLDDVGCLQENSSPNDGMGQQNTIEMELKEGEAGSDQRDLER